ncbi:hypothetical protein AHAS_Ahas19G0120000 [Arachis hypogaea]
MRYCPTPQNDSCHYANGGWEYQQEMIEYEHLPETQNESYFDESNNYSYCEWEGQNQRDLNDLYVVHQEKSSLECAFNKFMQDFPPIPQDDPYCDEFNNSSSCAWEDQNQRALNVSNSINQEPSELEQSFNSFMQNCPTLPPNFLFENPSSLDYASTQSFLHNPYDSSHQPQDSFHYTEDSFQHLQNSFHNSQDSFHIPQNNFTITPTYPQNLSQPSSFEPVAEDPFQKSREILERQEQSWREQETLFQKMDKHLEQIRRNLELSNIEDEDQYVKEEVEEQENEVPVSSEVSMKNEVVEVFEHMTSYSQKLSELTEEHEDSPPKDLMEDHTEESKEVNQRSTYSVEAESFIEEGLMELPIQETFDEENTSTITQPPSLEIKEVKATNKNTENRIVTKPQLIISMRKKRSTANNPTHAPQQVKQIKQITKGSLLGRDRERGGH